jgi:hypothetical protein
MAGGVVHDTGAGDVTLYATCIWHWVEMSNDYLESEPASWVSACVCLWLGDTAAWVVSFPYAAAQVQSPGARSLLLGLRSR